MDNGNSMHTVYLYCSENYGKKTIVKIRSLHGGYFGSQYMFIRSVSKQTGTFIYIYVVYFVEFDEKLNIFIREFNICNNKISYIYIDILCLYILMISEVET